MAFRRWKMRSVIEFDRLSQDIKNVDDYFIRQAKDRKNLFLRGQNPKDLNRYWGHINEMTEKINTQVDVVLENPLSKPYQTELQTFMSDHTQLMTIYQEGFNIFQETQKQAAGDQHVRGKGSDVGAELTQILAQIKTDRQRLVLEKEQHMQQFLVVSTGGLILVIVICSGLLVTIITDPIRRVVRFTRFLEERHSARQASQTAVDHDGLDAVSHLFATELDQTYQPAEGYQQDEIGYMFETYSKLAGIISNYNHQLRVRDGLLNCVNVAAQCLVANDDLTVALPAVLKILGEGTGQCRAYILQNLHDPQTDILLFDLTLEWDAPNVLTKREAGGRFPVPIETFPDRLTAPLKAGCATQFLASELDGLKEPEQGQALSLVGVPITVAGEWWGLLGLDDCIKERVWSEAEIAVLEAAATSIGTALERDRARKTREASEREALMARERAARAAELEAANQILSVRERWLETTAAAAHDLLSTVNVDASVNAALQRIGENLGCDRIVVMRHIPAPNDLGTMRTIYEWDGPDIRSQLHHPDLRDISSAG
ncbi:MAG: GAF domain-containing protein [Cyanobacteria bacterium P01_A01_bin.17]